MTQSHEPFQNSDGSWTVPIELEAFVDATRLARIRGQNFSEFTRDSVAFMRWLRQIGLNNESIVVYDKKCNRNRMHQALYFVPLAELRVTEIK